MNYRFLLYINTGSRVGNDLLPFSLFFEVKWVMRKLFSNRIVVFLLAIIAILAVVLILVKHSNRGKAAEVQAGVAYLESLEAQEPADVEAQIKQINKENLAKEREEIIRKLESGELDVWSQFKDYVLMGDSRAVGYEYWHFLPDDRVIASAGATIREIKNNMETVVAMNPSYVFLCYGLNDVSIGFWPTPEEYVAEFTETLTELQERIPGVKIIVSSILPAQDPAFQRSQKWYEIPDYSAACGKMCEENGWYFADNTEIVEEYRSLYDIDGIHFQQAFYPHWAVNLIDAMLRAAEEA